MSAGRLRGLQITMALFGVILVLEGGLDIALPVQRAEGMGLAQCAQSAQLPMTILGATWLLCGGWLLAAVRDPLRHLDAVKLALAFPLVLLLALVGAVLRGYIAFQQIAVDIGFDVLFFVLFLVFFPRGAALTRPG
jgi:hypothetical protein